MAKLFHILAASVGGGLVLGASIRLGEAIGRFARPAGKRLPDNRQNKNAPVEADRFLAERLAGLEERLQKHSGRVAAASGSGPGRQTVLAGVTARVESQQSHFEAIRRQVGEATCAVDSMGEIAESLRRDLHRQLSAELDQRLSSVEEKLQMSLAAANRETLNAMVASLETKVAPRISHLEDKVSGQSAAVAELRDCSLKSEQSVLRLLTALERTVNPASNESIPATEQPEAFDLPKQDPGRLSVMTSRPKDESDGGSAVRRPVSFR